MNECDYNPTIGTPIVGLYEGLTIGICDGEGEYVRLDHLLVRISDDEASDLDYELLEEYCLWCKEELFVEGEVIDEVCSEWNIQSASNIVRPLT